MSGLPAGVTLQQIDGGPTYYADNGYTYATEVDATMAAAGAKSWDDPTFFPIGNYWAFYASNSPETFKELGFNFANVCDPDVDRQAVLHANGIWNIDDQSSDTYGNETVALHVEEPSSFNEDSGGNGSVEAQVQGSPFPLTGRFIQTCFTWASLVYDDLAASPSNVSMAEVFSTEISTDWGNVRCNIPGADNYVFAYAVADPSDSCQNSMNITRQIETGTATDVTPAATADQSARGTNYGDMIDLMRAWAVGAGYPAPVWPIYIETDDALSASIDGRAVLPAEMNWGVWASLIHGARGVTYFATASDDDLTTTFGLATMAQEGQVVSNYTQCGNTNGLVQNLAVILNSPFAINYVTVSPAAYSFGQTPLVTVASRNGWGVTGIDVMAKVYSGATFSNASGTFPAGFYIFATYRGSETATDVAATFTVAGGYSGTVYAINADGGGATYGGAYTLTASSGVFSDTFATGSSVRIYWIPWTFSGLLMASFP